MLVSKLGANPSKAAIGISELLINAVEHGNLEIGFERKSELLREGTWDREIERRLAAPDYASRRVNLSVRRQRDFVVFHVSDDGPGFDWRDFLEVAPSRAFAPNGRGIALARQTSFDGLEYRAPGNRVVAWVRAAPHEHLTEEPVRRVSSLPR